MEGDAVEFQFYKVRLKGRAPEDLQARILDFNSIKFD